MLTVRCALTSARWFILRGCAGLRTGDGMMERLDNSDAWGRKMAQRRQNKADPGSPCERCNREACPNICFPKHDFELHRRRRKET